MLLKGDPRRRKWFDELEPIFWDALQRIARRERMTVRDICEAVEDRAGPSASLASALRVFVLGYLGGESCRG